MQNLPRLRVLVLEDNPLLQKIVYNLATCSGMAAQMVNGQKAVSVLTEREGTTDLLVIGWDAFAADEFAAASFLRQADGMRIPVIVHLADKDEEKIQQAKSMGIATVLPRIFSSHALREMMKEAIHAATSARRAALEPHIPGLAAPTPAEQEAASQAEQTRQPAQPQIVYETGQVHQTAQESAPAPGSDPAVSAPGTPSQTTGTPPAADLQSHQSESKAGDDLEPRVELPEFGAPSPGHSATQSQAAQEPANMDNTAQATPAAAPSPPPPEAQKQPSSPPASSAPANDDTQAATTNRPAQIAMKWAETPQETESPAAKAKRLFEEGRDALKAKDHERAAMAFSKILAMRGRFPDACRGLAIAHQRMGNLSKFNHYMNMAAEGYVWKGNNGEAEKLFANLKRHHCQATNPYLAVADVLFQRGKGEVALTLYEKALLLEPDSMATKLSLARACQALQRDEDALEHVVTVLQLDDTNQNALSMYLELTGKDWHIQEGADAPQEVWEVEELEICPALDDSGPVLFMEGESSLDIGADLATGASSSPAEGAAIADAAGLQASGQEATTQPPERKGPPTILIVDDEPHIRMLLEETLESLEDEGVTLLYAENGEEGLETIKEERPHLVFLDVMMPKMNGFDVCDWVKNKLALEGIYIIMLTAKGQEFDSQRGMEVGADVYMTKPFRPSEVLMMARTVLGMD